MLDGRIDVQGLVTDLKAQGILDGIKEDELALGKNVSVEAEETGVGETSKRPKTEIAAKKPRKLVKDEHREVGGVKWRIYNRYLQASSVTNCFFHFIRYSPHLAPTGHGPLWDSSYV